VIGPAAALEERVPRVALISPDPSFQSLITDCLGEWTPSVEWVLRAENDVRDLQPENAGRLAEREPDLLFIDVGESPLPGAKFISAVTDLAPNLIVVATGAPLGVDDLLQVIKAGASGYLRRPLARDEVSDVCSGVLRKILPKVDKRQEHSAQVIALFSPKGGTGVSTLAANLSVHIQRATEKKTLLVDLSPELGTCSLLLGMEPRYSYLDVIESLHRMDEGLLHSFLGEHASGMRVLASPSEAFAARELTSESVTYLLRLLRRHFDYVVVDVGRGILDQAAVKTLELADEKLAVTTAELPTLRNVKKVLPHLPAGESPSEGAIRLVINRYDEGESVPKSDIERAVGLPVFQTLDEDRERVSRSVNLGQPIVMNGSSPYSKAVGRLGDQLAASDLLVKQGRRPLGGLLRAMLPGRSQVNGRKPTSDARSELLKEGGK
jgi:pilus assembly protein CpaE